MFLIRLLAPQGLIFFLSLFMLSASNTHAQSLFKNASVRASSSASGAAYAVDGDLGTAWNSGGFAPAWIDIATPPAVRIEGLKLTPAQTPSGSTRHRVTIYIDGIWQEVAIINETTSDSKPIYIKFSEPKAGITNIRIDTLNSPSWVAWFEIEPLVNIEDAKIELSRRQVAEKMEQERREAADKAERQRQTIERQREEAARASSVKKLVSGGAQALYLQAGKAQRSGSVQVNGISFNAEELYELIVEKFSNSDYAVKATDQLTAMGRSERQAGAVRDAANATANAQRDVDRNSSNRAACFSQVRSCEAGCSRTDGISYHQYCTKNCQRTCN